MTDPEIKSEGGGGVVHTAPERMVCEAASYVFGELMRATAGFPSETCVTDPDERLLTSPGRNVPTSIVAQCCEDDGTCRRFVGSNSQSDCISGHGMRTPSIA